MRLQESSIEEAYARGLERLSIERLSAIYFLSDHDPSPIGCRICSE
jgi:hypothetical protein